MAEPEGLGVQPAIQNTMAQASPRSVLHPRRSSTELSSCFRSEPQELSQAFICAWSLQQGLLGGRMENGSRASVQFTWISESSAKDLNGCWGVLLAEQYREISEDGGLANGY